MPCEEGDGGVYREKARDLIDRAGILRRRCDLDLLVFFARHPNSLLPSETLAALLGYDLQEIAESLDVLVAGRLLQRTQTSAHAGRLYVFAGDAENRGWLPALLDLAFTRPGRLALRFALPPESTDRRGTASS